MSVLGRKTRIVSFRCTEEEYEILKERCIAEGRRSISDFARISACSFASDANHIHTEIETQATIHQLKGKIEELDSEMRRLVQQFDPPQPDPAAEEKL